MARMVGVELQNNWRIDYALTKIRGIGWSLSKKIINSLKIAPLKKIGQLTPGEVAKITAEIEKQPVEGDLVRKVKANIARLQIIGSYRGLRHTKNLPARGQRTRTNARTKRGKRKTVGAFKKEILTKMQKPEEEKGRRQG